MYARNVEMFLHVFYTTSNNSSTTRAPQIGTVLTLNLKTYFHLSSSYLDLFVYYIDIAL